MKRIAFVFSILALSACEKSYEDQVLEIENLFAKKRVGTSADYILVKNGTFGPDKVAVIFGFLDDREFCNEVASMYMQRYPASQYFCIPANQ